MTCICHTLNPFLNGNSKGNLFLLPCISHLAQDFSRGHLVSITSENEKELRGCNSKLWVTNDLLNIYVSEMTDSAWKENESVTLRYAKHYCWRDKLDAELGAEVWHQRAWIRGRDAVWESSMNLTVNRSLFQPLATHRLDLLQPHHRPENGACMHGGNLSLNGDSLKEMAQVKTLQSAAC